MSTKRQFLKLGVALSLGLAAFGLTGVAEAWEPKKPIQFVIMAGKGGGADKMARLLQSVVEKNKWSSKPLSPINKLGGSGAEALVHLKNAKDPDHTIMVTLNSFYTTPMRQPKLGVDITKFTPVARMAEDTFLLWVNKDSGITNVDQFVAAAKKAGNNWIMAGTGKLQEDQLLTDFLNAAYGLNMKYIPYKGGGKVAKQLAGNHANSTVNNPSEQEGFYAAGTTVALAGFTDNHQFSPGHTGRDKLVMEDGANQIFARDIANGAPQRIKKAAFLATAHTLQIVVDLDIALFRRRQQRGIANIAARIGHR